MTEENNRSEEPQGGTTGQDTQVEERARVQGWMPYQEWVDQGGDPDQWKPAEKFVKDGEDIPGIVKERNRKLEAELRQLREDFKQFRQHMNQQMTKREQKAYDQALKDLQQKQRQAVEEGDTAAFDQVEREKERIQKERDEAMKDTGESGEASQQDPVFEAWVEENPWYQRNPEMAATAEGIANAINRQNPNLTGKPFLDEVTRRIKKIYPDEFSNPKREGASKVEGGQKGAGPSGKKKSYSDLPDDAKRACDRFVKQGIFKNRDEYVQEYFAGEMEA
jgi:type II secretory pathway pseudopilin PulG